MDNLWLVIAAVILIIIVSIYSIITHIKEKKDRKYWTARWEKTQRIKRRVKMRKRKKNV